LIRTDELKFAYQRRVREFAAVILSPMRTQAYRSFTLSILLASLMLLGGCKVNYSLSGASIPPEVKTITVKFFPKTAALGPANLSQTFTERLKEKFIGQTGLVVVDRNGDLQLEGAITGYSVAPQAIQPNETAAKNRLTITVNVKYTNTKDEKQSFESSFSRFTDYSSAVNLAAAEDELVREVFDQLVDDIFNKAVINW